MCAITVVAFTASTASMQEANIQFDANSVPIRMDAGSSRCLSKYKTDFKGPFKPVKMKLKGIIGGTTNLYEATMVVNLEDDQGETDTIQIPHSIWAPDVDEGVRIVSPQHWAQEANDHRPQPRGTWSALYDDEMVLYWKQRSHVRTIKLDKKGTNVATIRSAPGFKSFETFLVHAGITEEDEDQVPLCLPAQVVSDDEQSQDDFSDDEPSEEVLDFSGDKQELRGSPIQTHFDLDGQHATEKVLPAFIEDEEDKPPHDITQELLWWHHKCNHAPFKKLQRMAKTGQLPKRLMQAKVPLCTACLFGKATRRPWRTKYPYKPGKGPIPITAPGDCVSVDQLVSPTPGLIGQLRGTPTVRRYLVATVFVDHFSNVGFVYLQQSTNAVETVKAKSAFERWARGHGVTVKHYHADNGVFADNLFRTAVQESGQTLSFCGVNAHHENGKVERRIRELQENARTMLIHAHKRWPEAISVHLWPYALRMANEMFNSMPSISTSKIPISVFSDTQVVPNPKMWHTFGAPAFVLNAKLQAGQKINKWAKRTRMGIYLGPSPQHARTIGLVLSLETGLVSPQFHLLVDSKFQSVRKSLGASPVESQWQVKCHFKRPQVAHQRESRRPIPSMTHTHARGTRTSEGGESDNTPVDPEIVDSNPVIGYSRAGRPIRRPQRYAGLSKMIAFESLTDGADDDFDWGDEVHPLLAMAASADPDTMYHHQAMREPDAEQFRAAMQKEVQMHLERGNFRLVHRSRMPRTAQLLPAVWAMKRKRRIATREVYKHKARLNIDGSKQIKGWTFWETYSPVATWSTIRICLTLALLHGWETRQVDYVWPIHRHL